MSPSCSLPRWININTLASEWIVYKCISWCKAFTLYLHFFRIVLLLCWLYTCTGHISSLIQVVGRTCRICHIFSSMFIVMWRHWLAAVHKLVGRCSGDAGAVKVTPRPSFARITSPLYALCRLFTILYFHTKEGSRKTKLHLSHPPAH